MALRDHVKCVGTLEARAIPIRRVRARKAGLNGFWGNLGVGHPIGLRSLAFDPAQHFRRIETRNLPEPSFVHTAFSSLW